MACDVEGCKAGYSQVYMQVASAHGVLDGLTGACVLPMGGPICEVAAAGDADVPLTLSAPFIVFPEGFSYPEVPASEDPLLVVRERPGGGRTLYFAGGIGSLAWTMPYPDLKCLIANAVRWAAHGDLPVAIQGPPTLQASLRVQPGRRMVHLINLTGGERFFS